MCCQVPFHASTPFPYVFVCTIVVFASVHPSRCRFLFGGLKPSIVGHRTQPLPRYHFHCCVPVSRNSCFWSKPSCSATKPRPSHCVPHNRSPRFWLVPALTPVDNYSSRPQCATEQQHSVPVMAMDPRIPLRTRWGKQREAPIPALAPVYSFVPQGGRPPSQPLRPSKPQLSVLVPALAPVESAAPQGVNPHHNHYVPPSRSRLSLSRLVVHSHQNHCVPPGRTRLTMSRPSLRLTQPHHRVGNAHRNRCVPASRSHRSVSRPLRRLTGPQHKIATLITTTVCPRAAAIGPCAGLGAD